MAAEYIMESEKWDEVDRLFDTPELKQMVTATGEASSGEMHATHSKGSGSQADEELWVQYSAEAYPSFTGGFASAKRTNAPETEKHLAALRSLRQRYVSAKKSQQAIWTEILELLVAAELESTRGKHSEAIELVKRATALEEQMSPPSGPPDLVKPSHEVFGEILLRAHRANEASAQFATALARQPLRARSLLGAARAAALNGDTRSAGNHYAAFLKVQAPADERSAEVREARDYLEPAKAQAGGNAEHTRLTPVAP
jgi:hypothetical protein